MKYCKLLSSLIFFTIPHSHQTKETRCTKKQLQLKLVMKVFLFDLHVSKLVLFQEVFIMEETAKMGHI